ncbi:polysaccharide lyase 8 family protein [Streptococcus iniae]|uniref:polysaccharide lyase 8 family protein n=1 Tax=Streptococcus iniae TaxID=1346 RepID=UPI002A0E529E|nr:polysaccharide lyase 8 family protein [Streptococcus iniae]ELY5751621.1 polysaccharide lyase 8 family protein [Streptococcus iniae]
MGNPKSKPHYFRYSGLFLGALVLSAAPTTILAEETLAPQTSSISFNQKENATTPPKEPPVTEVTPKQNTEPSSQTTTATNTTSLNLLTESSNKAPNESGKPQNRIQNGHFDQVTQKSPTTPNTKWSNAMEVENWSPYIDSNNTSDSHPLIAISDDAKLTMESQIGFRGAVTQVVKIDPSQQYDISFDIATENKEGQAFLRIVEKNTNPGQANRLWLSPMTSGTSNWHTVRKIYSPKLAVSDVTIELYYEQGTGKVSFDNISMIPLGKKDSELPKPLNRTLEKDITLPLNNYHLMCMEEYSYTVRDPKIATLKDGIITPLHLGTTVVEVKNAKQEVIQIIPLKITEASDSQFKQLSQLWNTITLGNKSYNDKDPNMLALFEDLENKAKLALTTVNTDENKNCLWNDLNNFSNSAQLTAHYRRLEDLAKQITNPASTLYHDAAAIRLVKEALDWLSLNHYNANKDIEATANWWDYEIGSPRAIVNTLTMMLPFFSDQEIQRHTDAINHFVPDPYYFRKTLVNPFKALGGNLVDMGRVKLLTAILRQDKDMFQQTVSSLYNLFKTVDKGEGFYADGSYIDHTNLAYTGAYGSVLIDGLTQLIPLVQQSPDTFSTAQLDTLYSWINKAFLPLIVKGELMDMSRGRSISRESADAHDAAIEIFRGLLRLTNMSKNDRNSQLQSTLKSILSQDKTGHLYRNLKTYTDIANMNQLLADNSIAIKPISSYLSTFNSMDKLAYYNAEKDFAFALSMHSSRTQNYEGMNGENTRGWYTADGMFYLYNDDQEHYTKGYWATVNPYKMPGTTEKDDSRLNTTKELMDKLTALKQDAKKETGQVTGHSPFVGSLALSPKLGIAAMDFANWDRTLTAKKGWVILDDKIVFLGSDIQNLNHSGKVSTTIDQRKEDAQAPYQVYINGKQVRLSDGVTYSFSETDSIFLESALPNRSFGYIFLKPTTIDLKRQTQSGSFFDINTSSKNKDRITNAFITISQNHFKTDDSYAYLLIPNTDKDSFQKISMNQDITIIENSKQQQLIHDKGNDIWALIKYKDDKLTVNNYLRTEKAGLYLFKNMGDYYQENYYQPDRTEPSSKTITRLLLPETLSPKGSNAPLLQSLSSANAFKNDISSLKTQTKAKKISFDSKNWVLKAPKTLKTPFYLANAHKGYFRHQTISKAF